MRASIRFQDRHLQVDLGNPVDLSIPVENRGGVNAWYVDRARIHPHEENGFVGSVEAGNAVNFRDISFNPHAHGTHTETLGHISETDLSIHSALSRYFFLARVISLHPQQYGNDQVLSKDQLEACVQGQVPEAVVIRTLPNPRTKLSRSYSHTNWPYLQAEAVELLAKAGVSHLLIDTPSVDKEKDDGALLAHKAFWYLDGQPRLKATITEFIYVPDDVPDGDYLLELQVAAFVNDAAPSRPLLYPILEE